MRIPTRTPTATRATAPSWTLYSVSVRFGQNAAGPLRSDLARLTPLPSAKQPEVMFMGVTAGGRQAAFALGAGLSHSGPGLCRPSRAYCAAILLGPGQTERLTVATGDQRPLVLRVTRIAKSATHQPKVALAAYRRHSAAGLCDLALGNPVLYSADTGTVRSAPKLACRNRAASAPFAYAAAAS